MTRGQLAESGRCFLPVGAPGTHETGDLRAKSVLRPPAKTSPHLGANSGRKAREKKTCPDEGKDYVCLTWL